MFDNANMLINVSMFALSRCKHAHINSFHWIIMRFSTTSKWIVLKRQEKQNPKYYCTVRIHNLQTSSTKKNNINNKVKTNSKKMNFWATTRLVFPEGFSSSFYESGVMSSQDHTYLAKALLARLHWRGTAPGWGGELCCQAIGRHQLISVDMCNDGHSHAA